MCRYICFRYEVTAIILTSGDKSLQNDLRKSAEELISELCVYVGISISHSQAYCFVSMCAEVYMSPNYGKLILLSIYVDSVCIFHSDN